MLTATVVPLVLALLFAPTDAGAPPPELVGLVALVAGMLGSLTFQAVKRISPTVDNLPGKWKVIAAPLVTIAWLALRYFAPEAQLPADLDAVTVEGITAAVAIPLTWACHWLYVRVVAPFLNRR